MADDLLGFRLWELGIEQGDVTLFREVLPAQPIAQQADTIMPIHLSDDEVIGPSVVKQLAFGIDTG